MNSGIISLTLILALTCFFASAQSLNDWILYQKLPGNFEEQLIDSSLQSKYKLDDFINPYYLFADFNGDKKNDLAVTITERKTGKKGFIIFHQGKKNYYVIGAGILIGNGGDNFDWMDIWKIYNCRTTAPGSTQEKLIRLKANAILVGKSQAASAIIYWTGNAYKWIQQGD